MCVEGVLNSAQFARISPLSVLFVGLSVVTRIRTVGEGDIWTLLEGGDESTKLLIYLPSLL